MEQLLSMLAHKPSFDLQNVLMSLGTAIVAGIVLNFLYTWYYRDNEPQDGSLARGLVTLTPAMTITFLVVQSSVALSLGLLGSLSFVRFRTQVKRTEDVSFVISAIAVAIACAVQQFEAVALLVGFMALYSATRNRYGAGSAKGRRFAVITFNTARPVGGDQVEAALAALGVQPKFISSRTYDGVTSLVLNAASVPAAKHAAINERLRAFDERAQINIFYPDERLGV